MGFNRALAAWSATDASSKIFETFAIKNADFAPQVFALADAPGRPLKPALVPPRNVPRRSLATEQGRAALVHAVAHIEFNAINIALDAALRFPNMPSRYYQDWLSVAKEEAQHFSMLRDHLEARYGIQYGDCDAHDSLWEMAQRTNGDVLARMALVPRILEARGLDVTPGIAQKLKQAGDGAAADILAVILREEVGHVAIGNHWFAHCCKLANTNTFEAFQTLRERYNAPEIKLPINVAARRAAGFTEAELEAITK